MSLETPWTRARKARHEIQEESLGKMEGGSKGVNSGRFWRWKRDGRLFNFLVEARRTDKGFYKIDKAEFLSIRKEAFQTPPGCMPMLQVDIQDLQLGVIQLTDFHDMIVELEALRAQAT